MLINFAKKIEMSKILNNHTMTYSNTYIYEIPEIKNIIDFYLKNEIHDRLMEELLWCNQVSYEEEYRKQSTYVRYNNKVEMFMGDDPQHYRYFIYEGTLGLDKKWTNEMRCLE